MLQNEHETKFIAVIMSQTSVIKEYQSPSPLNDIMITYNVHVFHIFCAMTQNVSLKLYNLIFVHFNIRFSHVCDSLIVIYAFEL